MVKLFVPVKSKENAPPSPENLDELYLANRFGHTPYFLLYDTNSKDVQFIKNSSHHFDGNTPPFILAKQNNAEAVLAAHLGYKPYQGFKNQGIPIYQVNPNESIGTLVKQFSENNYKLLDEPVEGTCCSGH